MSRPIVNLRAVRKHPKSLPVSSGISQRMEQ